MRIGEACTHMCMFIYLCLFIVWNLSAVKAALSHLHWQRQKVLRSETPLHLKLGSNLMEVVGALFHLQEEQLFSRPRMVKALLSQHKRGSVS